MNKYQQSIGKEAALKLADSKWWETKTHREIAKFQLFTAELCCPFGVFHEAVQKSLGRPVWTHEFGLNLDGLIHEFIGEADPPTMEQIMDLIPEEKRVIVRV